MEFTLAFVLFTSPLGGPQDHQHRGDRWIARDKLLHFSASLVIQSATHSVLRANGFKYRDAAWTAGATTLAAGLSKEFWDVHVGKPFSWKDLGADAVGGGTGAVLVRQMYR